MLTLKMRVLVLAVIVASAACCAIVILLLRPLLLRHALAHPNARSSHKIPTPQGGGFAVLGAAIAIVTVVFAAGAPLYPLPADLGPLIGATVLLAALGAVDDVRPLPVWLRLLVQLVAVATVAATLPVPETVVSMPAWAVRSFLVLAGIWFVNLVNFMDGLDWMTVAEVVPISAALLTLGELQALAPEAVVVAAALLGGMIGFSPFNRPVATLFLGDVGSLPIGLLLGWLLARLAIEGHVAAALLLPGYYLADSTLTLVVRALKGEPVWRAHRTHFYQRATDRGFSVTDIIGRVFALNLALAVLALATAVWANVPVTIGALLTGAALIGWLLATFARGRRRPLRAADDQAAAPRKSGTASRNTR
jgi:UDP-N-acetylmuramyl pentapeptide phosphotransferase/UDP-N-acetylglucosamine-1-phosphate transferase